MKKSMKIIILMAVFFLNTLNCFASTNTYNRSELKNYGVNKKWKITEENKQIILNTPAVDASEKIYDYADILTEEQEKVIKEKIDEFITTTKMDMVIVVPDFKYYSDSENEDYAANFYDYNDFGIDFPKYSGVVFLRNDNLSDRYYNIYTFGNAQLYFDYDRLETILDDIYYSISNGNYVQGFSDYIDAMTAYYKDGISSKMKDYRVNDNGYLYKIYKTPWAIVTIVSTIITFIIMLILVNKNKMVKKASTASDYFDKKSFKITNFQDKFISSHTSSYTVSSSSGSGGGGGSHSGSSGGGHSGGGGRHG